MKSIIKYLNESIFGNLGLDGTALFKDDIEQLKSIYSGPQPEYITDNTTLIVKYPFNQQYVVLHISKPLDKMNADSIKFVTAKDEMLNRYVFGINQKINYPGRLFDKMIFPKHTDIEFTCENDFKLDDDVFKDNKFEDKLNRVSISDEANHANLDLSELTEPITNLVIFDFKSIKFNPKQKINTLKLKMIETVPHINTLPDCDALVIDTQILGNTSLNTILTMFDDYTPNKRIPKIMFEGNLSLQKKLKIKNIINADNK